MLSVGTWILAFATLALPAAVTPRTGKAFTVNQEFVARPQPPQSPADLLLSTYYKYANVGARPPAKLLHASKQQGSVVATPATYDGYYAVPVTAGDQPFYLDFDTGSSDLWLFSTLLPANESAGHSLYDPTSSPTARRLPNYTWAIQYGDGSAASGIVYSDTVDVGGVTASSQAVEAATSLSSSFASGSRNGLLGLAYSQLNFVKPVKQKTFFDTVKPTLQKELFTVDLKHQAPGSYDFGVIDKSKYNGKIVYTPVNASTGLWLLTPQGFMVGNRPKVYTSQDAAVADTGTSLLYVPTQTASAYYAEVPQAVDYMNSTFVFPCNATLPDFHIIIKGTQFTVPGKYLNYAPVSNIEEGFCLGGLQAAEGFSFSVFGDIFLKSVFAVFDQTQAHPRLGIAAKTLAA